MGDKTSSLETVLISLSSSWEFLPISVLLERLLDSFVQKLCYLVVSAADRTPQTSHSHPEKDIYNVETLFKINAYVAPLALHMF